MTHHDPQEPAGEQALTGTARRSAQHSEQVRARRSARHADHLAGIVALGVTVALMLGGCLGELIGGMAQSAHRQGSTSVAAKTDVLDGHSFAVVVVVDRSTAATSPALAQTLSLRMTKLLAENSLASGFAPAEQVIAYLGNKPSWRAWPRGRLPEELGVDRVVLVDMIEYRVYEPGNAYLWDGLAWGSVEVYDAQAFDPDRPIYEEEVRVRFPDATGVSTTEMQESLVKTELLRRFVNRASWLFYEHKEANVIKY